MERYINLQRSLNTEESSNEKIPEKFPSYEDVKLVFEVILKGRAYKELVVENDENGLSRCDIEIVLEDGSKEEFNYQKALYNYQNKSLESTAKFSASIHKTKVSAGGVYYRGECVANFLDDKWVYVGFSSNQTSNLEKKIISEEEVVWILNRKGVEDKEVSELLNNYAIQCENEFEERMPEDSNRAHLECSLKLARLYGKTEKYKDYAIESLEEILQFAYTVSAEFEKEISDLIESLRNN